MKIIWEVDDGYIGKSAPQHTEVPDDELDECESVEEKQGLIDDYVALDFEQKITWHIISKVDI